jgi:hypothetical protein
MSTKTKLELAIGLLGTAFFVWLAVSGLSPHWVAMISGAVAIGAFVYTLYLLWKWRREPRVELKLPETPPTPETAVVVPTPPALPPLMGGRRITDFIGQENTFIGGGDRPLSHFEDSARIDVSRNTVVKDLRDLPPDHPILLKNQFLKWMRGDDEPGTQAPKESDTDEQGTK